VKRPNPQQPSSPRPLARWPGRAAHLLTGLVLTFIMSGAVSAVATLRNMGLEPSLANPRLWAGAWIHAFVFAWPVAFAIFWFVAPRIRRIAERLCDEG
jgi:hypothetical protein